MGILTPNLSSTGIDRDVWEALAEVRGTSIEEAESKAQERVRAEFPCNGERVTLVEAAIVTGKAQIQIHRWIKLGAVHVYERTGSRGRGAQTIIDLGSLRAAIAKLNGESAGSHAVRKAVLGRKDERRVPARASA